MRAVFNTAGYEYWGVQIDKDGWLEVIERIRAEMLRLEKILHHGTEEHDGLDVHIIQVRKEKYFEVWHPYHDWMLARDAYEDTLKPFWEANHEADGLPGWGKYKNGMMAAWYEEHGRQSKPKENTEGANLGSPAQVKDGFNRLLKDQKYWLYAGTDEQGRDKYKRVVLKSVNEKTLTPLIGLHPLIQVYIDYQHAKKIVSVYGPDRGKKKPPFIERLDHANRLRPSYNQLGADTGRYSSNFQQIPDKGIGAELRKHVVAAPGYTLVVADYSNIELRILAEVSGDQFLLAAFASGIDIHSYTAGVMFGLASEQINEEWTKSHNVVLAGKEIANTTYRTVS